MAPVFQIQIDDPQEYHIGGGVLSGKLLLVITGHALSLKEIVLRVICEMETSVETQIDNTGRTKTMKGSMRLYDGEMDLPLHSKHFTPGRHEIPFRFPLPADRPRLPPTATDVQQPTTYGHINFRLKAHARKSASSWFSSGEIKTAEGFMFMPPSTLTDEHNNAPSMQQTVMSGYVGGAASESAQSDGFWSRLTGSGSKRRKEPPLEVQCLLSSPTTGLAQDRTTQFQLRIVSSNSQEPIMVQSISLTLETIVTLVANGSRVSSRRASQSLVQAKVLRSGTEVDVSDLLNAVEVRSRVLPTFQTPLITYNYALVVMVTLVRAHHHRGESANLMQRLPIRVLSPYIIDDSAEAIPVEPADSQHQIASGIATPVKAEYPPEKPSGVQSIDSKPTRKPVAQSSEIKEEFIYGPTPGPSSSLPAGSTQSTTAGHQPPVKGSMVSDTKSSQIPTVAPAAAAAPSPTTSTPVAVESVSTTPSAPVAPVPVVEETHPTEPPPAYSE